MSTIAPEARLTCRIDLGAIVFDGDRDMRKALMADALFCSDTINQNHYVES